MALVNFCKKLYNGYFESAEEALDDQWLKTIIRYLNKIKVADFYANEN